MASKRILVIGGTGAQGHAVVKALLAASPVFTIRVLSRNPDSENTRKAFEHTDVELVKGSFMNIESVRLALQDCYGVYVNTDGFTVKESDEIWAAMRIFEIAKRIPTLRHLVWSGIDYYLKIGNFDPKYGAFHTNAKGRFQEFLQYQPSSTADDGLTWSILMTGAYTEMLAGGMFAPTILPDGTLSYCLPLGKGHLPLMTLPDCGFFAAHIFQNRETWSGKSLMAASHFATGPQIVETVSRVAGVKAEYHDVSIEEWVDALPFKDGPVATSDPNGPTVGENFSLWWPGLQDSLLLPTRDMDALRKIHPGLQSLEQWMRDTGYDGTPKPFLKGFIDNKIGPGY